MFGSEVARVGGQRGPANPVGQGLRAGNAQVAAGSEEVSEIHFGGGLVDAERRAWAAGVWDARLKVRATNTGVRAWIGGFSIRADGDFGSTTTDGSYIQAAWERAIGIKYSHRNLIHIIPLIEEYSRRSETKALLVYLRARWRRSGETQAVRGLLREIKRHG
jgi:hypothetical protein